MDYEASLKHFYNAQLLNEKGLREYVKVLHNQIIQLQQDLHNIPAKG